MVVCDCLPILLIHVRADDRKGYTHPPKKTLTKRGTLLFADGEDFDVHVVVGINPTAQHDICDSTVQYSLCSYTRITASEKPNAQHPVVQALSSPKSETYVRVDISARRECVFYLRRAS